MQEVTPATAGNEKETVVETQRIAFQKKIKKMFGHVDFQHPPEHCPVRHVLAPVTDKWSMLILLFLGGYRTLRFNDLKRNLYGISSKILTERLKFLEADGYITRTVYAEVPVRVEYQLSDFGYQLLSKLLDLTEWVNAIMPDVLRRRYRMQAPTVAG